VCSSDQPGWILAQPGNKLAANKPDVVLFHLDHVALTQLISTTNRQHFFMAIKTEPTHTTAMTKTDITAVILAGGKASRMEGLDKGLIKLANKALIEYVINTIQQHVNQTLISANRSIDEYQQFGFPVISDDKNEFNGPLSGICEALKSCNSKYLLVLPCDCPFIAADIIEKLYRSAEENNSDVVLIHDGQYLQPLFSLISKNSLPSLEECIAAKNFKVKQWMTDQNHSIVKDRRTMMFFNINNKNDLESAEKLVLSRK